MTPRILFITGTDTGVGKTLLTALLLCYLRARGSRALALKPFCSGSRADARLLHALQDRDLTLDEVNPFYFPEPVAPLVSARKHRRLIPLDQVVQHIGSIACRLASAGSNSSRRVSIKNSKLKTKNFLLIEGSGGLLVPLGEGYTVRDLIARLNCEVIVVSRNQLGTINHTLLTVESLRNVPPHSAHPPLPIARFALRTPHSALKVLLMDSRTPDSSSASNAAVLGELLTPTPLFRLPFLGPRSCSTTGVKKNAHEARSIFAQILS